MTNELRSAAGAPRPRRHRSVALKVLATLLLLSLGLGFSAYWYMFECEGFAWGKPLEEGKGPELAEIRTGLVKDVAGMVAFGPRNSSSDAAYGKLRDCESWVQERWRAQGYEVRRQSYLLEGREYSNLEIELPGAVSPAEIVIISAQYDTLPDSPGANNNASGMAVLFALSDRLRGFVPNRTLRLVAFVNEEDPYWGTEKMGSYQYAKRSHDLGERIRDMLSLDSLGIYLDGPGTQRLPFPANLFYPDRGNFLAFIGNLGSRQSVLETTRGFRSGSAFPIRGGVVPASMEGAGWSDHWSFWQFRYPGMQVTDTGASRAASHVTRDDTVDKLNFDAMARIVFGMQGVVLELTRSRERPDELSSQKLIAHGLLILLIGALTGIPYWAAIIRGAGSEAFAPWRVAHVFLCVQGMLILVAGLALPRLALGDAAARTLAYSLIGSGYGFVAAFLGGAWTGRRGLTPKPYGLNTFLFAAHLVGILGALAGLLLMAYGAFRAAG